MVYKSKTGSKCPGAAKSVRALGLGSYRTSWLLLQKLRKAMIRPDRTKLGSEVEVDEIYFGGPEDEGVRYRSTKRLILIAAEKNGKGIGRIRMKLIPSTSAEVLITGVKEMVEIGSVIDTDAWRGYLGLSKNGFTHRRIQMATTTKQRREADALPRVHRVSSLFKRWLLGTYQGSAESKYFQNYLDEFVFRFNRRTSGSRGLLFKRLLENAVKTKYCTHSDITSD